MTASLVIHISICVYGSIRVWCEDSSARGNITDLKMRPVLFRCGGGWTRPLLQRRVTLKTVPDQRWDSSGPCWRTFPGRHITGRQKASLRVWRRPSKEHTIHLSFVSQLRRHDGRRWLWLMHPYLCCLFFLLCFVVMGISLFFFFFLFLEEQNVPKAAKAADWAALCQRTILVLHVLYGSGCNSIPINQSHVWFTNTS